MTVTREEQNQDCRSLTAKEIRPFLERRVRGKLQKDVGERDFPGELGRKTSMRDLKGN